ncbi:MAG: hypothetical protein ABL918_11215 [Chakrabartia sp.]
MFRTTALAPPSLGVDQSNPPDWTNKATGLGWGLSPSMALRIEKAFAVKMDTLLRMQTAYEIAQARATERQIEVPRYLAV